MRYYILEGHEPKAVDLFTWAEWLSCTDRHVADEKVGNVRISTVFLGLNHNFLYDDSVPILFETMIFGGTLDQEQCRYVTWKEAEQGHKEMVQRVKDKATKRLFDL